MTIKTLSKSGVTAGLGIAALIVTMAACTSSPSSLSVSSSEPVRPPTLPQPSFTTAEPPEDSPDTEEEMPSSDVTLEQANAIDSAMSYLRFSAFSRSGLISQLEYEGFSNADATFAVDSLDVDWDEQAAKSAANYLDVSAFSESGLIDQLKYEGFSTSQAEYGAAAAFGEDEAASGDSSGGDSASRRNAVESASSYLEYTAFSRSGLIDQLEYEGYSTADATYAVDAIGADWNEQAALSAENYLDVSSFSRSSLIDQLMYEGFTRSQAEYGVSQAGL